MTDLYRFLSTSQHPLARAARSLHRAVQQIEIPAPQPVVLPLRVAFEAAREAYYFGVRVLVSEPLLKSYAREHGRRIRSGDWVHWIRGSGDLILGDDVAFSGKVDINFSSRFVDRPTLRIGDGTGIGHGCHFTVARAITIGRKCRLAAGVRMFDSNGHPADPAARRAGAPPPAEEVRPIVIADNVWIGAGALIFPGVTIGEDSVVSAGSAVFSDVPPRTIVAGNPARPVRTLGDPSPARPQAGSAAPPGSVGVQRVVQVICAVARLPRLEPDDDLQRAGLTSLQMLDLRLRLEDSFAVELPDDRWLSARTARQLWALIEGLGPARPTRAAAPTGPGAAGHAGSDGGPAAAGADATRRIRVEVELAEVASELIQEELPKAIGFLDPELCGIRFLRGGAALEFAAPAARADELRAQATAVAERLTRSLRGLTRRIVRRTARMDDPRLRGTGEVDGVRVMGRGQVALEGMALRLHRYFDRTLAELGEPFAPTPMHTPTLIPASTLARCDYFRAFPHVVTFATHLPEDLRRIDAFRARHDGRDTLDEDARADMVTPEACLSPAVCYHVYAAHRARVLASGVQRYAAVGRCFRRESVQTTDLRRLWEFTMRELVFLGDRDGVLALREQACGLVARYLDDHELAAEIRTASDPFFIAPDAAARTYFQLGADTKWEVSLLLPGDERLACGSLNFHSDFFGRAFDCDLADGGPMHSVCVAFGVERWIHGFLAQHGDDPARWPELVRRAPELAGSGAARGARVAVPAAPREFALSLVPAAPAAAFAGAVLRDAWAPPALVYSDALMAWQFDAPGPEALAVSAHAGDEPAGVVGVSARRFRLGDEFVDGCLVSFLGVRPAFRGRGLAVRLYRELMGAMQARGLPGVAFVAADAAPARRALLGAAEALGLTIRPLGACVHHGWHERAAPAGALIARETRDAGELLAVVAACDDPDVLLWAPDVAQIEHALRDPRDRRGFVVEQDGRLVAACTAVLAEHVGRAGAVERIATVDALWSPEPTPERIAALFRGAAACWAAQASSPVISAPNVSAVSPVIVHGAGLRPTGTVFGAFLLEIGAHPLGAAERTNLGVA